MIKYVVTSRQQRLGINELLVSLVINHNKKCNFSNWNGCHKYQLVFLKKANSDNGSQ